MSHGDNKQISVLFVCLGNICRSPMAEAVFRHIVKKNRLGDRFVIDSAGTAAYHVNQKPDSRSVLTCTQRGVSISHRARQVQKADFDQFDYILCMDEDNLEDLLATKPKGSDARVELFGTFGSGAEDRIIKDPYYGGGKGFVTNFEQVTRCSLGLLRVLGFGNAAIEF
ncbi:Low molecular weight phosphotyrosine protein phosphatase [Coemansia spiralis]|uniref:Low molecular weight phosphotyrosine protein phosphatase n=2 Tax=Coemansia TaxID=4863 RepID=A0A9W8KWM3_9FUNG|nr:phosphotyrosine protein phosphatase I superfamily [Coemansia spiralis]KAJ1990822.1 Low molecular weight phosphotyrosine protein phosphatase [Coemansia umbellata]KAJ2622608.1 Low molecular weight phosphotyrosine protein phosphatase [Coemansia sp. RSA 1358]KAJ2672921.1 Low molecular weight phosphotyrosine protein phosphatase [Coemansia spiralis]